MIPRYFLLLSELAQIDSVLEWEIDAIKTEHPGFGHIFSLLNQKIDLINHSTYDSLKGMLPSPTHQYLRKWLVFLHQIINAK